jgi:Flp pilus assembly protein TadD
MNQRPPNSDEIWLLVIVLVLVASWAVSPFVGTQIAQTKDVLGGASELFKKPKNPPAYRRKRSGKNRSNEARQAQPQVASSATADGDVSDEVEDAIALGNISRDREPPDLASAERAYRLAWKLNSKDPRPYIGLANVYMDQQKYQEAAEAYREALKLSAPGLPGVAGIRGRVGHLNATTAEWQLYLATARIQSGDFSGAEKALGEVLSINSRNAEAHALLGYSLFSQKKYRAAVASYRFAVQLAPGNKLYRKLLNEAQALAALASAEAEKARP